MEDLERKAKEKQRKAKARMKLLFRLLFKKLMLFLIKLIGLVIKFFVPILIAGTIIAGILFFASYESQSLLQEYDYRAPNAFVRMADNLNIYSDEYKPQNLNPTNQVTKDFYTYFSKMSYWQVNVKDKEEYGEDSELISPDHKDAVKDFWKREEQFFLPPNMLYNLDLIIFENYKYPEQFTQPVAHDKEEFKLKQILNEVGDVQVESKKINIDTGEDLDQKEFSVVDYGLAPVFKYKETKSSKYLKGYYNKKDVVDPKTGEITQVEIEEEFQLKLPDDPVVESTGEYHLDQEDGIEDSDKQKYSKKYILDEAITLAGNLKFKYENTLILRDKVKAGESEHELDNVDKIKYGEAVSKVVNLEKSRFMNEWVYDEVVTPLYKYRSENSGMYEEVEFPVEPEKEDEGLKYYYDYLDRIKAHLPYEVLLDIRRRINYDLLNDFLVDEDSGTFLIDGQGGGEIVPFKGMLNTNSNVLGSATNSQAFKNAMQYFHIAQKYGAFFGVDPYIIIAMAAQESGGNPKHAGGGLLQISGSRDNLTITASGPGGKETFILRDPYDPEQAIHYTTMRIKNALDKYNNDYLLAMESYNKGGGTVGLLLKTYPEKVADGTWLEVREDIRYMAAQKFEGYGATYSASQHCIPPGKQKRGGVRWGDTCYLENVLRYYGGNSTGVDGIEQGSEGEEGGENKGGSLFGSLKNKLSEIGSSFIAGANKLIIKFMEVIKDIVRKYQRPYSVLVFDKGVKWSVAEDIRRFAKAYDKEQYFSETDLDPDEPENIFDDGFIEKYKGLPAGGLGDYLNTTLDGGAAVDFAELEGFSNFIGAGGYSTPVKKGTRISSGFGYRIHPVSKKKKFHEGIDLPIPQGSPVFAVKAGTVTHAGDTGNGYGWWIEIDHGGGIKSRYAHLSLIGVKKGQVVETGQVIAKSGGGLGTPGAGTSTGPHLHFEIRKDGKPIDPKAIMDGNAP